MKIYIDGSAGTTGLQIYERLAERKDIELLTLPDGLRKDASARRDALNSCDITFLCLPDDAAREAVGMIENPNVRVIDASTAHRTAEGWAYGFPELSEDRRAAIERGKRIANPGCHATGFIACVYPLVKLGLVPADYPFTCFSLTGYSGGGKKMIADYENSEKPTGLSSPRIYALTQQHKHLSEMQTICGLTRAPVFSPIVDDYYKGMATTVTLHLDLLPGRQTAKTVREALDGWYQYQRLINVAPLNWGTPMTDATAFAGRDDLMLIVSGSDERVTVTALFDNLGKGASGAAVQNMNLLMGADELTGLNV